LMNLCTNALHALPGARGRIEVGLAALELVQGVAPCPAGLPGGRYVQLWVQDDGVGMDAATRERAFEPFFTTKPVGQGTGLGLAVVHGIVKAHQGAITVHSAPGAGARLAVVLPRVDPAAPTADEAHADTLPQAGGRGGRVLYLDDDEVMVAMVERLLARGGFQVQCAARASDALALLSRDPAAFDVVVTDFNMPGMNGAEFAQAVRGLNPALPVVMSSGYVDDAVRQAAQEAGVVAVLYKEDSVLALAGLLRQVLDQAEAQQRAC
jgi:CheY-like chemotaxis protein